jgi:hypothetical protein
VTSRKFSTLPTETLGSGKYLVYELCELGKLPSFLSPVAGFLPSQVPTMSVGCGKKGTDLFFS